jgi:hypothetical protein
LNGLLPGRESTHFAISSRGKLNVLPPAEQKVQVLTWTFCYNYLCYSRGVAQLVARTAGGREVAGSSPVTPTTSVIMV